jgi:outer membrane protein OmpA-like peptidoglycan-associated protein
MKRPLSLLLLFFVLMSSSLSAQTGLTLVFSDDFDNDDNGWNMEGGEGYSKRIENGKFIYTKNSEDGKLTYQSISFLDPTKEYVIEAEFTHTNEEETGGGGIVWGHGISDNSDNRFMTASSGYYMIATDLAGRDDLGEWVQHTAVKYTNEANKLKVHHKDGLLHFYINDILVATKNDLPWFGKTFGIITYANEDLVVDNYRVYYEQKINLAPGMPTGLVKENLGENINTPYPDLSPLITVDGRRLYFSIENSPENLGGVEDDQDIWISDMGSDGQFLPRWNLGPPINTEKANNLVSVSPDQNQLVFNYYVTDEEQDFKVFTRTAEGWDEGRNLGARHTNEARYFEACMSPDGRAIVYTAQTKDNLVYVPENGERDVYVVLKKQNGEWSPPLNLGPTLNTGGDEYSPFLAADGKTLYFGTDGRPGYGNVDIFMSRRLDDTWTRWSEPLNLGPAINTPRFDAYYSIPASGAYAYMCSQKNSIGRSDIVRVKLPEALRPEPVILVKGKTLNARTLQPVSASIQFEDLGTRQISGEAVSAPGTGAYQLVLPYGRNYGLHAFAEGYLSVNENFELANVLEYREVEKDLYLVPIVIGETLTLNNVFFEKGKAKLLDESFPELDRLVFIMRANATMEIELAGHTDNVGNHQDLVTLSQNRVAAVREYLIDQGIPSRRITGKGYGPSKPVEKNDTEDHKRKNRRVEFRITKL